MQAARPRPLFLDPTLISEDAFFHMAGTPTPQGDGPAERNPRRADMWRRPGRKSVIAARTPNKEEIERNQ